MNRKVREECLEILAKKREKNEEFLGGEKA